MAEKRPLVIAIGGMATHVLNCLLENYTADYTPLIIETDAQALLISSASYKMLIGKQTCKGIGAGRNMAVAREAAARDITEIKTYLDYTDTVCLVAGLGGGTGGGAIQVIARYALDLRKRVCCFVSMPFDFEGKDFEVRGQSALDELKHIGAEICVLNNQDILTKNPKDMLISQAFIAADKAVCEAILPVISGFSVAQKVL